MKLFRVFAVIGLIGFISNVTNAQFIDKYGIRTGFGISNHHWYQADSSGWTEKKTGFVVFINAEKQLNKYITIRTELGYINKGYSFIPTIISVDSVITRGSLVNVNFHDLSFDLGIKAKFSESKLIPYIIAGFRFDYMISYKVVDTDNSNPYDWPHLLESDLSEYNRIVVGGLVGIGIEYNDLVYFELEYNHDITKLYDKKNVKIYGQYFGLTCGINISELIKK